MAALTKLELHGFKSIRHLPGLSLGRVNVLIGSNGAGKSNLVSFFRFLSWMTASPGNMQLYVGKCGGANSLLYDGAAATPQIEATLTFDAGTGTNDYSMRLSHAAPDTLIFADEKCRFRRKERKVPFAWISLGSGHKETRLIDAAADSNGEARTARIVLGLMKNCVVYQFHNTSETARIRQRWTLEDDRFLKEDGANLAPFLCRLQANRPSYYARITETIRQVAPFFADFVLEPQDHSVLLQWRERDSDLVFGPHQASDGTLRVMALISLLLQPAEDLPSVVILDEPELGLHPFAMGVVAGLLKAVSAHSQVILATQSTAFVDQFEPENVIVVDRPGGESKFARLDREKLKDWLEEYTVAELWEKNVIGGRPA